MDVVKAYIERIRLINPLVNALIEDRFNDSLEEAKVADALVKESGKTAQELEIEKPLLGVPITVKSNIAVKGMLHESGLYARKGIRAEEDAYCAKLLRDAGAIIMGITNVPELSASFNTYNKLYGQTLNPHDLSATSGGSSGGESALITSAASVLGLANDMCGSLRMPSAVTGIFAHKPTRGLISNVGIFPALEKGKVVDQVLAHGPMCRYAVDLTTAMKVLAKTSSIDFDEKVDFTNINIFYCDEDSNDPLCDPVNPEARLTMRKVLVHFHKKYSIVPKRVSLPGLKEVPWILSSKGAEENLRTFSSHLANDPERDVNIGVELFKSMLGISKHTLEGLWFAFISKNAPKKKSVLESYRKSEEALIKECDRILTNNSILLFPSCPAAKIYPNECLTKFFMMEYFLVFNILGVPVTQCPLGKDAAGYPLSIQVVAGHNRDRLSLAFAEELEREFGGWQKPCKLGTEEKTITTHIKVESNVI